MTETTTPSVEGDRLEAIARIIDPWAFGVVANIYHGEVAEKQRTLALAKARQIAALPCKGGGAEDDGDRREPGTCRCGAAPINADGLCASCEDEAREAATPTPEPDTGRGLREALEKIEALTVPGSKARLDRSKRTLDAIWLICRNAAALSDAHETPEKQA